MRTKQYKVTTLEDGWEWADFENVDILDYCVNELDIPSEYLNNVSFKYKSLNLSLQSSQRYDNEDWFVNLSRLTL